MTDRKAMRSKNLKMALCGMLSALATAIMLLGGMIPMTTFCCPILACLALLPALDVFGRRVSLGIYAVAGILSLLLAPDKEAAFLFVFLGYYPILKVSLDRIRCRGIRVLCKLAVFNAAIALMYGLLIGLIALPELADAYASHAPWLLVSFVVIGNVTFLLFDLALARLTVLYRRRLKPLVDNRLLAS